MEQSRQPCGTESILRRIISGGVITFSLTVAILAGTVITVINQGETLARGGELNLGKALLTYITVYCMATYLALTAR
jgi:hypothetical protein